MPFRAYCGRSQPSYCSRSGQQALAAGWTVNSNPTHHSEEHLACDHLNLASDYGYNRCRTEPASKGFRATPQCYAVSRPGLAALFLGIVRMVVLLPPVNHLHNEACNGAQGPCKGCQGHDEVEKVHRDHLLQRSKEALPDRTPPTWQCYSNRGANTIFYLRKCIQLYAPTSHVLCTRTPQIGSPKLALWGWGYRSYSVRWR